MPKNNRLKGGEIRRLKPEKRLNSSLFSLSITYTGGESAKVACVVSKKVSMKAVVRNKLKRQMRAALKSAFPLPSGTSLILTGKKPALDVSYGELRDDILALISKLRSAK